MFAPSLTSEYFGRHMTAGEICEYTLKVAVDLSVDELIEAKADLTALAAIHDDEALYEALDIVVVELEALGYEEEE